MFADAMRPAAPLAIVAVLAVAPVAVPAEAATSTGPAATLTACTTGDLSTSRALQVNAAMPSARGARVLAMRFELRQRVGRRFRKVSVPAWAPWVRSDPRAPGFVLARSLDSLRTPAVYRVVVRFRWYDGAGRRIKSALRETKVCRQTAAPPATPQPPVDPAPQTARVPA